MDSERIFAYHKQKLWIEQMNRMVNFVILVSKNILTQWDNNSKQELQETIYKYNEQQPVLLKITCILRRENTVYFYYSYFK